MIAMNSSESAEFLCQSTRTCEFCVALPVRIPGSPWQRHLYLGQPEGAGRCGSGHVGATVSVAVCLASCCSALVTVGDPSSQAWSKRFFDHSLRWTFGPNAFFDREKTGMTTTSAQAPWIRQDLGVASSHSLHLGIEKR